jgi:ribonucleotide reductase alpha subunit
MTEFKTETAKQVYYRTYSRTKPNGQQEEWPETVRRVVDGNLKLVEPRYIEEGEREALIDLIESFKVLPAGRHLKSSGVNDFALNNCWAAGWDPAKPEEHFTFTLLRLAEGGGVGSNYSARYLEDFPAVQVPVQVHIVCDPEHPDYLDMVEAGLISTEYSHDWAGAYAVEDSREGWAEALGDLIRTAHDPKTRHQQRVYDVSRVRCKGSPLRTFGGTASGPEPFAEMMWEVGEILSGVFRRGDVLDVFDGLNGIDAMRIDHAIAKAIVAGGVRRSARMSIMRWDDPLVFEFIDIKKEGGHWTTNISVEVDQEFFKYLQDAQRMGEEAYEYSVYADEVLKAIAEGMLHNGEPGVWNSALTAVGEVDGTYVTNPCFHPDTMIETIHGRKRIADITEPTKVLTRGLDGKLTVRQASAAFVTKRDAETVRIRMNNGRSLVVTPVHRVMLVNGKWIEARDLKKGDRLEALCRSRRGSAYAGVRLSSQDQTEYRMEHRVIWEGVNGPIPAGYDINHIDRNTYHNDVSNMEVLTHSEHGRLTSTQHENSHQVRDEYSGKFVPSGKHGAKTIVPLPAELNSDWTNGARVVNVEPGPVSDVYDITVEETHNVIADYVVAHNCGEATLTPWEPCNLGSVNLAAFVNSFGDVDFRGLEKAHRLITRYLIRATFADVADPKSAEAIARYRRIGVGHLGFADFLYHQGITYKEAGSHHRFVGPDLELLANVVDEAAAEYSNILRIPTPIKKRVIAPTGTTSKLAGVSGEATHAPFASYFIRRIRFSNVDPNEVAQVEEYRRKGYRVEPCQYAANTSVVEIPTKDSLFDELEYSEYFQHAGDLTIKDMLNVQRLYQEYWADQAVSYTANVPAGEYSAEELAGLLAEYLPDLKGVTVFPEMSMPQSPYERVSFEEYKARAEEVGIEVTDTGFDEECASGACPV